MSLNPYPAYKPSGVPWLGDVPDHWDVVRLKGVCRLAYGDSLPTEARRPGGVPVFGSNGRVGEHDTANTLAPCLVIGRKGSFGKITLSREPSFAIDTTFFVDARYTTADLGWLYYVLGWASLDAVSKDSAVPGLDRGEAYQTPLPLPPLPEQRAIVRYLDHHDRLIRRYLRAKRRLIALLEEQKQAIIQRAVTRGPDPHAPLKPSGVEWLGEVPAHWEVVALRHLGTKFGSGMTPRGGSTVYQASGIPLIRSQNVHFDGLRLRDVVFISDEMHASMSGTHVMPGDVLINITGASIGRVCVAPDDLGDANVNQHVSIIRPHVSQIAPQYN